MKNVLERLLNLLACLLTADRPVPAEEIRYTVAGYEGKSDDAFHRMFERDKDLLREMGVPLELRPTDVWEVEFGYVLPPEEYQLDDPGLIGGADRAGVQGQGGDGGEAGAKADGEAGDANHAFHESFLLDGCTTSAREDGGLPLLPGHGAATAARAC